MKNLYLAGIAMMLLTCFQMDLSAQTLPTGISGLKLWLDASDVNPGSANPVDGTNVTLWKDKSGLGNNAVPYGSQAAGRVYSNQINGKSVIRFNRVDQFTGSVYETPGVDIRATAATSTTIFTVYKQGTQSPGINQAVWGNDNGGWDRFFFSSYPTAYTANDGGVSIGTPAIQIPGAGVVNALQLLTAVYVSGTSNGSAIYFNGQLVRNFTDATDATAAYPTLRIGFDGDDNCFNGDIAEMIVYNRQLTACEIQQVNRYLGAKYGVTFSTASVTASSTSFPEGGSTTLTASSGTAYQWLLNGTAISGATNSTYVARTPGNYNVAVTNNCIDTSAIIGITQTTMTTPGNGLAFDGVNDYVDCGTPAAFAATNIKTMEAWVKFNSLTADQEIISKSVAGSGAEMLVYNGGGSYNLAFYLMNNASNASYITYPASNLTTGIWYHLAATWDGTKEGMRLYVNGDSVGARTDIGNITSTGITNPAGSLKLGQWSESATTRYFNGSMDEVRIWSTTRTQAQIRANMYNIVSAATGLEGYYKFDLGTASGSNTNTALYDVSGNYRAGTLTNFALTGSASNWIESYGMVVPAATAATAVTSSGFTANWTAPAAGAVNNYLLYVSANPNFTSMVTGYNGLNVGTDTSYNVTGLSPTTTYYYRTRANKTSVASQGGIPATYTTLTTLATLPVTLASFTARQQGENVLLQWSTASELNTARFLIERSTNGVEFSPIGSLNAAGTSSALRSYNTTDKAPKNGSNFYRLKQVDADGNFTYSPVEQVVFVNGKAYTILYPSPATDHFTIETNDPLVTGSTGIMTDIQGRIVKRFVLTGNRQQISLSGLTKGVYQVQLANKSVFRIIKE